MAVPYTVTLPGGGSMTVNANSPDAAQQNAKQQSPEMNWATGGGGTVYSGGHQTMQDSSGNTVQNPNAYVGAGEQGFSANGGTGGGAPTEADKKKKAAGEAQMAGAMDEYQKAVTSGNKAAADEAIRQYNQGYSMQQAALTGSYQGQQTLAAQKQAFDIANGQAALTGTYNGMPTQAAELQASNLAHQLHGEGVTDAGLTGTYQGQQTQAAQQQAWNQGNQTAQTMGYDANGNRTLASQQMGLDALKASASMSNDPFRQQQYLYGVGQGGYSGAIDAMNGVTAMPTFQGQQGPSAAGTNTMGYLGNVVGGYANGAPGSDVNYGFNGNAAGSTGSGSPMGTGTATYNASLSALPGSANQIVGRNYLKAGQGTKNFITSGMSAVTGLDQATIDEQIKATMPGFKAPSFGSVKV